MEGRSEFIFRAETQADSASCFGEQTVDGNVELGGLAVQISGSYRENEVRKIKGSN